MAGFKGFSLKGKVCCVTGGSRGLGREIVLGFAQAGADAVVISSRKLPDCEKVAQEVISLYPECKAVAISCNVSKWEECENLFNKTIEEFGRCEVLVNNAGSSPLYPSLIEVSQELFDKVINLNLRGPFRLCALFGTYMSQQEHGGSIINVSTDETKRPSATATVYGAAKSGVNYLTQAVASAYGPKVRCNCIMPGPFLTDISKSWDLDKLQKHWDMNISLKRPGNPEEVVGAAIYFASDASSYTNGSILEISGGMQNGKRDRRNQTQFSSNL